jgi:hypothetical protein
LVCNEKMSIIISQREQSLDGECVLIAEGLTNQQDIKLHFLLPLWVKC